jgi:hypothetical protein
MSSDFKWVAYFRRDVLVNSTRLVTASLVFKTVLNSFLLHGSSMKTAVIKKPLPGFTTQNRPSPSRRGTDLNESSRQGEVCLIQLKPPAGLSGLIL